MFRECCWGPLPIAVQLASLPNGVHNEKRERGRVSPLPCLLFRPPYRAEQTPPGLKAEAAHGSGRAPQTGVFALGFASAPSPFVFELWRRLQLVFGGVHVGMPFLVVVLIFDLHGVGLDGDVMRAHAKKAAD
jgi:hypothetical protein